MYTRAVEKKKGESRRIAKRNRKNLSVQYMFFLMKTGEMLKKESFIYNGKRYYPLLVNPAVRLANIKGYHKSMQSLVKKKIHSEDM